MRQLLAPLVLMSVGFSTAGFSTFGLAGEESKIAYAKPAQAAVLPTGAVEVKYLKACGEEFRGVLVRESQQDIYIGVVVERTDKLCSALPSQETLVSPVRLSTDDKRTVKGVAGAESLRVVLSEVNDVTLSRSDTTVIWQDSCRANLGLVISPNKAKGVGAVSLNMAFASTAVANGAACSRELKSTRFSALRLATDQVHLLRKPGKMSDLYQTKLAAPAKIAIDRNGQLTVAWMASCRERGIGILFGGDAGTEIAVVSAVAPNVSCKENQKTLSEIKLSELVITPKQKLVAMTTHRIAELSNQSQSRFEMIPVSRIVLSRLNQGQWLVAGVKRSCARHYGVIAANDVDGNVSMAALSDADERICHVSEVSTDQTFTAPLLGPAQGPMPKIFGLKMFGTLVK